MRIQFDQINPADFKISERELEGVGSVFLINPSFDKHTWEMDEVHFRSVLCSPEGRVISSGFPKFFNYGEKPEQDTITQQLILAGRVWFAEKMDGSLIIRSVIDGKVHLRTRGSHTLADDFREPVMSLIEEKYPNLLDPSIDARYSLLFEYTAPDNQIILEYDDSKLTAIGAMDLTADPVELVANPNLVALLEEEYGTPAVGFHTIQGDTEQIVHQVRAWKGSEGIVVWGELPSGGMHLAKIKAAEYLRIHSLKFQLTNDKVKQLCWHRKIDALEQLQDEFHKLGVDWEAISFIEPIFDEYIARRKETIQSAEEFVSLIESEKVGDLPTRKRQAIKLQELAKGNKFLFNVGIRSVVDTTKSVQELIDAHTLGVSTVKLRNFVQESEDLYNYVSGRFHESA
jgi:hypothetical protein